MKKIFRLFFTVLILATVLNAARGYSYAWCICGGDACGKFRARWADPPPPPPPEPPKTQPPAGIPPKAPPKSTPTEQPPQPTPSPAASPSAPPDSSGDSGSAGSEMPSGNQRSYENMASAWEFWWQLNQDKFIDTGRVYPFDKTEGLDEKDDARVVRENEYKLLWDFLLGCLKDKDPEIRFPAVIALAKSNDKFAAQDIEKLLDASEKDLLNFTILGLGMLGDISHAEKMMSLLKDRKSNKITRGFAAFAIGFMGHKPSIEALKQFITDENEDWEVRSCAVTALGMMKADDCTEFLGTVLNSSEKRDTFNNVRACAVLALGRIGGDSAGEIIRGAVDDENPDIRRSAAVALGSMKYEKGLNTLIKILRTDRDVMARCFAAVSLGRLGNEAACDPLLDALVNSTSPELQGFAAIGLGILGNKEKASKILSDIADDAKKFEAVRAACALALGLLRDKDSIGLLVKCTEKKRYPALKKYAILALGIIGEPDKDAVKKIKESLSESKKRDTEIYRSAMYALMMLGEDKFVYKELKDDVKTDDSELKLTAIDLMGRLGDVKTAEILIGICKKEKQKNTRQFCMAAMGCLLDRNFKYPLLRNITSDNNYYIELPAITYVMYVP
ncbi:MAG: HEAT repeat domain-containing protein [Planctomycetes bacterium]|nr:HEAT repeat domain-containing protein [Planctomycetota bacterium]